MTYNEAIIYLREKHPSKVDPRTFNVREISDHFDKLIRLLVDQYSLGISAKKELAAIPYDIVSGRVTYYDNGGKSLDRITIVFNDTKRGKIYEAIGSCETGNSFFQHTECIKGKHLGKEIEFSKLDSSLQNRLIHYFSEES